MAQADYIYLNGRPVAVLNGSTLYYLHDDMLGTPQLATDSNQAVQWQASYDSFGQASTSGTVTQNLRLPGQYFDVESGWNHNGFRDYAPTLGRYLEPDPLGRLGSGNNLYVYVGDNPTNLIDPLGMCALQQCVSSQFPNVILVDFLPTVVNGEGQANNMTGDLNGIAYVEIDGGNTALFGEITNIVTTPGAVNAPAPTPYNNPQTGEQVGAYTSSANPWTNYTSSIATPMGAIETQVWELGNSLAFLTGTMPASLSNSSFDPGSTLLSCFDSANGSSYSPPSAGESSSQGGVPPEE